MKTSLLKLLSSAFLVSILLSSCLSDSDNTFKIENDFAYIDNHTLADGSTVKCAAVYGGGGGLYVSTPLIKDLQVGQCYRLGYEITNASNSLNEGTDIGDPKILPQTEGILGSVDINEDKVFYPIEIRGSVRSSNEFFGNRWAFYYTASMKDNDKIQVYFYYDQNNQREYINGEWRELSKNQLIIDVRLQKDVDGSGLARSRQEEVVGNFSRIKLAYSTKIDFEGNKAATAAIKFRYITKTENADPQEVYLGDWPIGNENPTYSFMYLKN